MLQKGHEMGQKDHRDQKNKNYKQKEKKKISIIFHLPLNFLPISRERLDAIEISKKIQGEQTDKHTE